MIYPDSPWRAVWDVSLFLTIIYQAIIMPMRIAFEFKSNDFLFYLDIVIDCMFLFDILLNFNTGFYHKGELIMKREHIVRDYLKNWFLIDLVSSMPFTWVLAWKEGIPLR